MAKYVDVNKVEENVEYTYAYIANDPDEAVYVVDLQRTLVNTPAAEVEPVRHGHWERKLSDLGDDVFQCSNCHMHITKFERVHADYCKYCGTKMDREDGEG